MLTFVETQLSESTQKCPSYFLDDSSQCQLLQFDKGLISSERIRIGRGPLSSIDFESIFMHPVLFSASYYGIMIVILRPFFLQISWPLYEVLWFRVDEA